MKPKKVPVVSLYASPWKLEETVQDIADGRLSHSPETPLRVSSLDSRKGFFVIDGHHRLVEKILRGESSVMVTLDSHIPHLERTGGGYAGIIQEMVNVTQIMGKGGRKNPGRRKARRRYRR